MSCLFSQQKRWPAVAWVLAILLLPLAGRATAQQTAPPPPLDPRVQLRSYVFPETGVDVPYGLFVPQAYTPTARWPLIVGLHGAGGNHESIMRQEGMVEFAERYGYIVVSSLGYHPRGYYGALGAGIAVESFANVGRSTEGLPTNLGELSEKDVLTVLELIRRAFNVDEDRIYLFGHSMGGVGSYHIASKNPSIWAGIAVAAPGSRPLLDWSAQLERLRDTPILLLHGDQDATIPVAESRKAASHMSALGMQFVYVEIRGGDHSFFITRNRENLLKVFSFFNIVRQSQRPQFN